LSPRAPTSDGTSDGPGGQGDRGQTTLLGPRANPARRFATWALAKQTLLTHAEIGKLFDVSPGQVANVLRSLRKRTTLPADWVDSWREEFDK
jgi:hypothetical protein